MAGSNASRISALRAAIERSSGGMRGPARKAGKERGDETCRPESRDATSPWPPAAAPSPSRRSGLPGGAAEAATAAPCGGAKISRRLPLGDGDRLLPDRGRGQGRRARRVDLGHLLPYPRQGAGQRQRRRRRRPLSPLQGRRRADEGARREHLPLLDLVAAGLPRWDGARRTRRASTSTTRWSTSCSPTASSPSPRSTTGTCRRRLRTRSAAGSRGRRRRPSPTMPATSPRSCRDRVKHFFTLNEFWTFIELGYGYGVHRAGPETPARRAGAGPPPRAPRARPRRPGDPRRGTAGHQGRARGEHRRLRAGDRDAGAHRGGEDRDARAQRRLRHGDARGPLHRRLPRGGRRRRAEVHARGDEDHRQPARLRRDQRLRAHQLRAGDRRRRRASPRSPSPPRSRTCSRTG